jgi:hypothetical protein
MSKFFMLSFLLVVTINGAVTPNQHAESCTPERMLWILNILRDAPRASMPFNQLVPLFREQNSCFTDSRQLEQMRVNWTPNIPRNFF